VIPAAATPGFATSSKCTFATTKTSKTSPAAASSGSVADSLARSRITLDFGTGYSSLVRVVQLPISRIKIDREFVHGIGRQGSAIIPAVMALSRHLAVDVVAEGCRLLQGYRYSLPIDPEELAALLRSGDALPRQR